MNEIRLRKAVIQDMELLYEWANEEAVRKNSINTHKIEFNEHKQWFYDRINRADCDVFIYLSDGMAVGQIRLDYKEECGWISFSIDYRYRGQGHGGRILHLAEEEVRKNRPGIHMLSGLVKKNNIASRKKFEELKYRINDKYENNDLILFQKDI